MRFTSHLCRSERVADIIRKCIVTFLTWRHATKDSPLSQCHGMKNDASQASQADKGRQHCCNDDQQSSRKTGIFTSRRSETPEMLLQKFDILIMF